MKLEGCKYENNKYYMKSKLCTDLEQSKRLTRVLSPESADMHYARIEDDDEMREWSIYLSPIPKICALYVENLPCWSLAALLDILPEINNTPLILEKVKARDGYEGYYYHISYKDVILIPYSKNPVDVCVEMIIALHEQKIL